MNQNFVNRMKQMKAESLVRRSEQKNEEVKVQAIHMLRGLMEEFKHADSAIDFKEINDGYHIIYANSINLRVLIHTRFSYITITLVYGYQGDMNSMEIYRGELDEEEILPLMENALVEWYQSIL